MRYFKTSLLTILIIFVLLTTVTALTATIGNSRMVIRNVDVGDKIEKYVLVRNVNDVEVGINLSVSGDLKDSIELLDKEFTLETGAERRAKFLIHVTKNGTTETNINVAFKNLEYEESGVGLHSTVIVIASAENFEDGQVLEEEENKKNKVVSSVFNTIKNLATGTNSLALIFLTTTTLILVIVLVVLIFIYKKNKRKKWR